MATTLTPKEIAQEWETDARTVRKFLRSEQGTGKVGQGNRHAVDKTSVRKLRKAFDAWNSAKAEKVAKVEEMTDQVEDLVDDLEMDELLDTE